MAYFAAFVAGLVIGSFLNVLVYRLPDIAAAGIRPGANRGYSYLALPLSFCTHCAAPIRWWHTVPLLSYLWLRGRCACERNEQISLRYPVVELLGGIVAVVCLARFGITWQALAAMFFCWILLAVSWLDWSTLRLPSVLLNLLLWSGLFVNISGAFAPLRDAVLGIVGGYLVLQMLSLAAQATTGKRMLGEGDPKLLAAIGAWLGWTPLPGLVIIGSALGAIYGLTLWLLRGRRKRYAFFPFAPFLAFAAFVMLIDGERLVGLLVPV